MKKLFKFFVINLALFVLVACGGDNSNNNGGGDPGDGGPSSTTYSITFSGEAANYFDDLDEFMSGQTFTLPNGDVLNTEDQTFYAWNDGISDYFPNQQYTIVGDVIFTAVYKPNLTLKVNGGYWNSTDNGHIANDKFKYGSNIEVFLYDGAPENKKFIGWYNGEKLISTQTTFKYTIEANTILTPKFIDLYVITVKNGAVYEEDDASLSNNLVENGFFYAEQDKSYRLVASKGADDVAFHGWKIPGYDRDGYNYLRYNYNGRNERVKENQLVQFTQNMTLEATYDGKSKNSLVFTNYDCPTNVYPVGYEIDYSKMFIDVTLYNDEIIRNINVTPSMVSDFSTDTEGRRTMKISYIHNGVTISEDVDYEVYATLASSSLELFGELEKNIYALNNVNVSLKGLIVKAKFIVNSTENVTEWRDVSSKVNFALKDGEDISTSGAKTYVITYACDGDIATEEITVTYTDSTIENPHNLSISVEDGKYYLTWEEVSDVSVEGYEIYKDGESAELLATVTDTKYEITSLLDGDTYLVRSITNDSLYSEYSSITLNEQAYYEELNSIKNVYENNETSVFLDSTFEYSSYPVSGRYQTYYDISNKSMYSYKKSTISSNQTEIKTYIKMLNSKWSLVNEYDLVSGKTHSYINDEGVVNLSDLLFDYSNSFTLFFYDDSDHHLVDKDSIDYISKHTYLDTSLYTMTATGRYYDYVIKIYVLNNRIVKLTSDVYEGNQKIGTVTNTVTYTDYTDSGIEQHTFIEPEKIDVKISKGTLYSFYEGYITPYKEADGFLWYKLYKGDNALMIPDYRGKYYRPDEILGLGFWISLSMTQNHDTGNLLENTTVYVYYDIAVKLEGNATFETNNSGDSPYQVIIDDETYYMVSETVDLSILSKQYETGEDPMGYISYWEINGSFEIEDEVVTGTPTDSGILKVKPKPGYVYKSYNTIGKMVDFRLGEDVTAFFGRMEPNSDYFINESSVQSGSFKYEYGFYMNIQAPMTKQKDGRTYGFVRFKVQTSSISNSVTFDDYDNDVIFKYTHSISYNIVAEYKDITDLTLDVELEEGFEFESMNDDGTIEYGEFICIDINKDLNPGEWVEFEDENGNKYYPGEWFNIYESLNLTSKVINETPTGIEIYNMPIFEVGSSYNSNKVKVVFVYPHATSEVYMVDRSNVTGFSTTSEGVYTMSVNYGGFTTSTKYVVAEYYSVTIHNELLVEDVFYDVYLDGHFTWHLDKEIEIDPTQKTFRLPKDSTLAYRAIEEDYRYMYSVINYPNSGQILSSITSNAAYITEDNITIDLIIADTVELVVDLSACDINKFGGVDYFVNDSRVFFGGDRMYAAAIPMVYIVQINITYSEQPYELRSRINLQESMIDNFEITTPTDISKTATITYEDYSATFTYRVIDPTKTIQVNVDSPFDVEYSYLDPTVWDYVYGILEPGVEIPYYSNINFDIYSFIDPMEKIVYSVHLGGKNTTIQLCDAYVGYKSGINLKDYLGEVTSITITYEFVEDTIDPDRNPGFYYNDNPYMMGGIFYDPEDMTKFDVTLINLRVCIYFETFARVYYISNDEFEVISLSQYDSNYMAITYKITIEEYGIVESVSTTFPWYFF